MIATALALAKRLGKVGVVVGNLPGFVGNRMMFPYMYETQFLVEEGATPEQVDRALTGFGMAMGMFAVDDMAGLDVAWRVRQELGHFRDPARAPAARRRPAPRDGALSARRRGKGWYRYDDVGSAHADPGPRGARRSSSARRPRRGSRADDLTDEEIVERAIYALINEGARVLRGGGACAPRTSTSST